MNDVFDRYRGRIKVSTPEAYALEFSTSNLREGARPALASDGSSHPAGPGQGDSPFSFDGGVPCCTTVPAEERPKEQAGLVFPDEWGV